MKKKRNKFFYKKNGRKKNADEKKLRRISKAKGKSKGRGGKGKGKNRITSEKPNRGLGGGNNFIQRAKTAYRHLTGRTPTSKSLGTQKEKLREIEKSLESCQTANTLFKQYISAFSILKDGSTSNDTKPINKTKEAENSTTENNSQAQEDISSLPHRKSASNKPVTPRELAIMNSNTGRLVHGRLGPVYITSLPPHPGISSSPSIGPKRTGKPLSPLSK